MSPTVILIIIGVILLIVVIVLISNALEKKRKQALAELAPTLGLTFDPGSYAPGEGQFGMTSSFAIFNLGRNRRIKNAMSGRIDDVDVRLFEYTYTQGHGKSTVTYLISMTIMSAQNAPPIPTLSMYPESVFSKIGSVFGGQDIDFKEFPEFSRRFVLKADDEAAVRAMIDAPTAAFFEAHKGIHVYTSAGHVLFYRALKRVKPALMKEFFDEALAVFRYLSAAASRVRR